ncbi:hypothetical protein BSM4216_1690 [Bacillus smithii]|nr:hypothetical protein BSM4216_1690 [Bacillus smithii]
MFLSIMALMRTLAEMIFFEGFRIQKDGRGDGRLFPFFFLDGTTNTIN